MSLQPHYYYSPSASPVDGRGSPVSRQDGRVVDDGSVLGMIDDVHGYELTAEWQHVEVRLKRHVLLQNLNRTCTYAHLHTNTCTHQQK